MHQKVYVILEYNKVLVLQFRKYSTCGISVIQFLAFILKLSCRNCQTILCKCIPNGAYLQSEVTVSQFHHHHSTHCVLSSAYISWYEPLLVYHTLQTLCKLWRAIRAKNLKSDMWAFFDPSKGSATKEILYTSWRNQLKSSWNHEKSKQIPWNQARKSAQPSSPTHFYNIWCHFWGKSWGNQTEIRKSRMPKLLVANPSDPRQWSASCVTKLMVSWLLPRIIT